jgi:hypothetical protein
MQNSKLLIEILDDMIVENQAYLDRMKETRHQLKVRDLDKEENDAEYQAENSALESEMEK